MRIIVAALAGLLLTGAAQEETPDIVPSETNVWVLSEKTDPLTDEVTHTATITSGRNALALTCPAGMGLGPSVTFIDLDGLVAYPEAVLRYRYDDGPVVQEMWRYSSETARAFDPKPFLSQLPTASRIRVQAASVLRGWVTADFRPSNTVAALEDLRERCN